MTHRVRHILEALLLLGILLFTVSSVSQEPAIPNWSAPPYWTPPAAARDAQPREKGEAFSDRETLAVPTSPLAFTGITPCRIADTRDGSFPAGYGPPGLVGGGAGRTFVIPSGPCPGLPAGAGAWSLNFTVVAPPGTPPGGYLSVWPTGGAQPIVSTLNFTSNSILANAAVVPAGTGGGINAYVNFSTELIIDINGYYAAQPVVSSLNTLTGALTLAPGTGISIAPSGGNTLTITNTAGGGGGLPPGSSGQTLRHSGSAWTANSLLTNTGSAIGIGITSPNEQLEITGNLRLPQTTATTGQIRMGVWPFLHAYGVENLYLGVNAGALSGSGFSNVGIGPGALSGNNGVQSTAVGDNALMSNAGDSNVAVGYYSLRANTSGAGNTAVGTLALYANTLADRNVALGRDSLRNNTTAGRNTAAGSYALYTQSFSNSNAKWNSENTAVGYEALYSNQPSATSNGNQNTAVGTYALRLNTTGMDNTAVGTGALQRVSTGSHNVAVGGGADFSSTASENTSVGSEALHVNSTGAGNTVVGRQAMDRNDTGSQNVAAGVRSLFFNVSGSYNVAVGAGASYNQTGDQNTAIGTEALHGTGGNGNVGLGYRAGYNETGSNRLHIANTEAKTLIYGRFDTDRVAIAATDPSVTLDVNGQIRMRSWAAMPPAYVCYDFSGVLGYCSSDAALKEDVRPLTADHDVTRELGLLRGVTFAWKDPKNGSHKRDMGVIAQEVAPVLPEVVTTNPDGLMSVDYPKLTAFLIEVAKAQQKEIDALKARLRSLERAAPWTAN